MIDIKRKWDILGKEKRESLIKEIITYFKLEQNQKIGILAAENILDFFLQAFGEDIYNKAIDDSKKTVREGFENLEVDLDLLLNK